MIDAKMKKIEECVQQGSFSKKLLHNLIYKPTDQFVYTKDVHTVVTNGRGATGASVMALRAVDGVLTDKRRADEVLRIDAKRQKNNGKKTRTPNKNRSQDGFAVVTNLHVFDKENAAKTLHQREKTSLRKK